MNNGAEVRDHYNDDWEAISVFERFSSPSDADPNVLGKELLSLTDEVYSRYLMLISSLSTKEPDDCSELETVCKIEEHIVYRHLNEHKIEVNEDDLFWNIENLGLDEGVETGVALALNILFDTLSQSKLEKFPFELKIEGALKAHLMRTALYAARIAVDYNEKHGSNILNVIEIAIAAALHDLGKMEGLTLKIVRKNGALTEEEYDHIKKHPELGTLAFIALVKNNDLSHMLTKFNQCKEIDSSHIIYESFIDDVYAAILQHHMSDRKEKSYPGQGLGKATLIARIIAVADAFDAMSSRDHHGGKMNPDDCKKELLRFAEGDHKQFDPEIVEIFTKVIDSGLNPVIAENAGHDTVDIPRQTS